MYGKRHTCVKKATQLYVCKCLPFSTHVWEKPLTCLFPPELWVVLVLRQHVRREAVIIIILLVVTTTVKVLERFQQFKNACNSFVGRVFPNLQQKCYFYDNIGNARISKAPGPATPPKRKKFILKYIGFCNVGSGPPQTCCERRNSSLSSLCFLSLASR